MKGKGGNSIVVLGLLLMVAAVIFVTVFSQARGAEPEDWLPEEWLPEDWRDRDRRDEDRQRETDADHARALWRYIEDYPDWPVPKGHGGWQRGVRGHGRYLRYYYNYAAREDLNKNLAVIVLENYSERDRDALQSVTVMQKRRGYDPENKDWFYVKYSPRGDVMSDRRGRRIAGAVGADDNRGCIGCHKHAPGDDYLYMRD